MDDQTFVRLMLVAAIALAVLWLMRRSRSSKYSQTVREGERGLVYRYGKFDQEVGPGKHWMVFGREMVRVSLAEQSLAAANQEVMTADRMPVKVTGLATYRITHPRKATEKASGGYYNFVYAAAQKALRDLIAEKPLEEFVDSRTKLDDDLKARAAPAFTEYGCELLSFSLRDVILPSEVRRLATDVTRAKLEAAASLERARGEQATLRLLANAARLIKGNPELMNLRVLQALSAGPGKAAPTIILGGGAGIVPVPHGEVSPESGGEASS